MSANRKGADPPTSANGPEVTGNKNQDYSCYFCNELFELGHLQNHLKQCGSILEQCPLRCGAWLQRRHKQGHVAECPRQPKSSPSHARPPDVATPLPTLSHTWAPRDLAVEDCVTFLEKEVAAIKLILVDEANQRDVQASNLDALRSKFLLLEEMTQHFLNTLMSLRASLDHEAERSGNWATQFKYDVSNVQLALQELQSQQLSTAMRLESAVNSLVHEQKERELLEQALTQHDSRIRSIHKLEEVILYVKQALEEERAHHAESRVMLETELEEARSSSAQLSHLTALRMQLQGAADRPALDRLAVLEVAAADARAESADQQTRVEALSKDLRALTKSYLKMRSELADFQARVSFGNPEMGADNGHLIWRIDNFAARMKQAKETDEVLSSPLFRTSKYGYTLKAEVNLNGIGKWRGRHLTSTVRLISGPHDPLLQWPCHLTVNIVLKDQPTDRHKAMDIVKSLELRRKSSSKRHDHDDSSAQNKTSSSDSQDKSVPQLQRQYIFIPHTSFDKFDYIKNDVMFIEFMVTQ